jgi:hypothetical protein
LIFGSEISFFEQPEIKSPIRVTKIRNSFN